MPCNTKNLVCLLQGIIRRRSKLMLIKSKNLKEKFQHLQHLSCSLSNTSVLSSVASILTYYLTKDDLVILA